MNLPNISILIPTYNRRNFIPFVIRNLKIQTYPHDKLQVVIDDDGTEPLLQNYNLFKEAIKPMKLKYIRNNKRANIGEKRNRLISNANNNIVVFLDDDDIYEPTYISHSYEVLSSSKNIKCVGSDKLIIMYPPYTKEDFYAIDANSKKLIHEATLMFYKSWYKNTNGFQNSNKAEALQLLSSVKSKNIAITNPFKTMIAIVHGKNTIQKDKFKKEENHLENIELNEDVTKFILECV